MIGARFELAPPKRPEPKSGALDRSAIQPKLIGKVFLKIRNKQLVIYFPVMFFFACGVMVSIEPSQGLDPGSIPGRRIILFLLITGSGGISRFWR